MVRLIDAPEFQRLRRIKQLGLALYTYQGADRDQRVLDGAAGRRRQAAFAHQRLRVARSQLADHLLAPVHRQPVGEHEELLRTQRRGDVLGDVFPCQVEHLAGRRIADVRDQHHFAGVERAADRERIHFAHRAGELEGAG